MTNATCHKAAIQVIPALIADIFAFTPATSVQRQLTELLEEKIPFMHLRYGRLPDGRRLIAAIEHEAISQSHLSAGPPGPRLPYSPTLEPGDLARAGWLWKARDSARIANNLDGNSPNTRDWTMFLLNPHLARCEYAAWVLVRLYEQQTHQSNADEIISRLVVLLNHLLLADFVELQQFLSGTPVRIGEHDVSRYDVTAEILLRKRNLLLASIAHPFLQNQLRKKDFWRRLPRDAEDLLTPASNGPWTPIVHKLEGGSRTEEALCSGLGVSAEIVRSLSSVTAALLPPHLLDQLIPLFSHLESSVLPRNDAEFLRVLCIAGHGGTHTQCEIFSEMSARVANADDLNAVKRWLRRYRIFTKDFASFARLAESLFENFQFNVPLGSPLNTLTLYSFLGEPTYKELDVMLDAWRYLDRHVREWMHGQLGTHRPRRLSKDLREKIALPGLSADTALWLFCLASLITCLPNFGYEASYTRAFSPDSNRGFLLAELHEALSTMAARL